MTVEELEQKIKEIRDNNPSLDVDKLELGPLFNGGVIMMTSDIYLVEEGSWCKNETNGEKAIAIEWHC